MDITLLGEQIQKFRKARGLTQRELGAAIGVSTQAVSQWENGGAPDVSLLPAVADRLGVTVDALFGREGGEVRDMKSTFLHWVRSLPKEERLTRITRLLWEAACYGTSDELMSVIPSIGYPQEAESMVFGPDGLLMRTAMSVDNGYILGVGAENYSYVGVFPKPEAGYEAYLLRDDEYRKLFGALALPGAMEILRYFCRNREGYYVPATVAQGTGLPLEETERVLEVLAEDTHQLSRREIVLPDGPVTAYAFEDDGGLVALLTFARWVLQGHDLYLWCINTLSKHSFEREEGQNEKP